MLHTVNVCCHHHPCNLLLLPLLLVKLLLLLPLLLVKLLLLRWQDQRQ
jgi:hypothetical protein